MVGSSQKGRRCPMCRLNDRQKTRPRMVYAGRANYTTNPPIHKKKNGVLWVCPNCSWIKVM